MSQRASHQKRNIVSASVVRRVHFTNARIMLFLSSACFEASGLVFSKDSFIRKTLLYICLFYILLHEDQNWNKGMKKIFVIA